MGALSFVAQATPNSDGGFSNDNMAWLGKAINVGVHLFLVGSFVAFAAALVLFVARTEDPKERFGRFLALFIGALIVVGSQAMDASYANFIISSLAESRSAGFRFFGAVLPAAAGLGLGYYLTRGMKRTSERTVRVMLAIGTLCVTQFALMYAIAVDEKRGDGLGREITPNIAFVAGLGLVLMLNFGVKDDVPKYGALGSGSARLRDRAVQFGQRKSAKTPMVSPLLRKSDTDVPGGQ